MGSPSSPDSTRPRSQCFSASTAATGSTSFSYSTFSYSTFFFFLLLSSSSSSSFSHSLLIHFLSSFFLLMVNGRREGVPAGQEGSLSLAKQIAEDPFLLFEGIYLHAGHSYECKGREEIQKMSDEERHVAATFAERLKKEGIQVKTVSVGSTPTCSHPLKWDGCTEIHPGNYVFYDCQQVAIGSAAWEDCAAFVLTRHFSDFFFFSLPFLRVHSFSHIFFVLSTNLVS